jgi:hypothetical protein
MMMDKNFAEEIRQKKRYKAIEKKSHELEMEIKSWAIENSIYHLPLLASIVGWITYGIMVESSLPYGENFNFLSTKFYIILSIGIILNFLSIKFLKPSIEGVLDKEEKELTQDVYQKGAKFCDIKEFNRQVNIYMENEYSLSKNIKSKEIFTIPIDKLDKR